MGKSRLTNSEIVDLDRNGSDSGGPHSHKEQRKNHLWQNAAVHLHKEWPFRVFGKIARTSKVIVKVDGGMLLESEWRELDGR